MGDGKLDEKIDQMFMLRETKRGLEKQVKEVDAQLKDCTTWLVKKLEEVGTTTARGSYASATIAETTVPAIDDWGLVQKYIMDNDALYLVHKRISSGAWKELLDTGEIVPGITPFTSKTISLRKLGD